jgi:hypothetical protein
MFTRFSFAPFAFSPIAFAIFDLIEEIQEEQKRSQVYGSGRKLAVPPDWNTGPELKQTKVIDRQAEDDLVAKVLEKWDAIEAAQAARAPVPVMGIPISATEAPAVDTSPRFSELKAPEPLPDIPFLDNAATALAEIEHRNAEKMALILAIAAL